MKGKFLKLKDLKKTWWWRKRDHRNPRKGFKPRLFRRHHPPVKERKGKPPLSKPDHEMDRVIERVAHNYELMRRCPDAKGFSNTYWELDRDTKTISYTVWASLPGQAYRFAISREMEKERGWTDTDPRIQWNLRLSDGTLKKRFNTYINLWRRSQNIKRKRFEKEFIPSKISWREIEILDRNRNHIGILNDSERHTASVALEKASQYLAEFKRGRAKFLKRPKTTFDALTIIENPPENIEF